MLNFIQCKKFINKEILDKMINGNINKYLNLEQENIKNKNKEIKEISPENNNL